MKKFEAIRQEIKRLSEEQRIVKPQRKQSFQGTRTVSSPSQVILDNKYELRHLFQAYAVIKEIPRQVTKHKEISESYVTQLVEKYGINL
jgi:hypothetical protein